VGRNNYGGSGINSFGAGKTYTCLGVSCNKAIQKKNSPWAGVYGYVKQKQIAKARVGRGGKKGRKNENFPDQRWGDGQKRREDHRRDRKEARSTKKKKKEPLGKRELVEKNGAGRRGVSCAGTLKVQKNWGELDLKTAKLSESPSDDRGKKTGAAIQSIVSGGVTGKARIGLTLVL